LAMLRPRAMGGEPCGHVDRRMGMRLVGLGLAAGMVSGFFGIGGGFLIVPGILFGSGMPILNAIGSSLFSVGAFALTTATNYALSGFVAWTVAGEFIAGGAVGGFFGMRAAVKLAGKRQALTYLFAGVIFTVAAYMLVRSSAYPLP
jgi:uncharacterized protein